MALQGVLKSKALQAKIVKLKALQSRVLELKALQARVLKLKALPARVLKLKALQARVLKSKELQVKILKLKASKERTQKMTPKIKAMQGKIPRFRATHRSVTLTRLLRLVSTNFLLIYPFSIIMSIHAWLRRFPLIADSHSDLICTISYKTRLFIYLPYHSIKFSCFNIAFGYFFTDFCNDEINVKCYNFAKRTAFLHRMPLRRLPGSDSILV